MKNICIFGILTNFTMRKILLRKWFFVMIGLLILMMNLLYVVQINMYRVLNVKSNKCSLTGNLPPEPATNDGRHWKTILFWNEMFGDREFYLSSGSSLFSQCPEHRCYTTCDRQLVPPETADAILFHGRHVDPTYALWPSARTRNPKTRYIFLLLESPLNTYDDLRSYRNLFNYTMTYRADSDVQIPYGAYKRRKESVKVTKNFAAGKSKLAAWLVSDCVTEGKRDRIVVSLQKHLQVDVYGKCGPLSCDDCHLMLHRHYKFYLAFENSLCKDYVTEKLFKTTQMSIVPIVYGGANYSAFAPPHSLINVADYESPKQLADYLTYLDGNDTAYNEYFAWRADYTSETSLTEMMEDSMCKLCEKLHTDTKHKTYDIFKWWMKNSCYPPNRGATANFMKHVL